MASPFTLFGDRVLLREQDDEKEVGGIALPESRTRAYLTMEVIAVGDGRVRGDILLRRKMCVVPGDRVMVQFNPMMLGNQHQKVGGQKYLALNHHDIIAKIDAGVYSLTLETFHPVGRWVLVRIDAPDEVGGIIIPKQASLLRGVGEVKTWLAKAGEIAMHELDHPPAGTRLMLEHARVSPFSLNRVPYAYVDCACVAGIVSGELDPAPAT